jgi:hypothetical protein
MQSLSRSDEWHETVEFRLSFLHFLLLTLNSRIFRRVLYDVTVCG